MPCYFPVQATFKLRSDGKRDIKFSNVNARLFRLGVKPVGESNMALPCGKCVGCRLERSRQWAVRCVHEAKMYERNCFLTLTYDPEHLPRDLSLSKDEMRLFNNRLRKFAIPKELHKRGKSELRKLWVKENAVRFFYCGEYGDQYHRPHYHSLVFNFDFPDKKYWKTVNGCKYYISDSLSRLWGKGFCTIGDVTFESAAYVARYALKKLNGDMAVDRYRRVDADTGEAWQVLPEFAQPSLKPGIGFKWFDRFADTDLIPHDNVIVRGSKCKVPRYYDVLWERKSPESFAKAKEARRERAELKEDDNSFRRLRSKLKCQEARMKQLVRTME